MADDQYFRYEDRKNIYRQECNHIPPNINSRGAWTWDGKLNETHFSTYSLPLLEFHIITIILINLTFHFIFRRAGLSKVVTHMASGLSISLILNELHKHSETGYVFPAESQQILATLSLFGYMMFLFITGVKMDMRMIRTIGKKTVVIGFATLVIPLMADLMYVVMLTNKYFKTGDTKKDAKVTTAFVNMAVTQAWTTFPVISYLLNELQILNSELARLALSSAVLSEMLSVFLLLFAMIATNISADAEVISEVPGTGNVYINLVLLISFLLFAVFIVRPAMFWVVKQTPEGRPVKDHYIMIIIIGVLLLAMVSHSFGQLVLFAPYIIGLVTPDGPPLGSSLVNKLNTFVSGLLLPIFITCCASRASFDGFELKFDPEVWGVIGLAILNWGVKIMVCFVITKWGCSMPVRDSLALSFIMSAKGIVEMATFIFLRDSESFSDKQFTTLIMTTATQAAIIPFVVRRLYDPARKYAGYQKRNITHLRPKDELRVIVCIHNPNHVNSSIKLLDASSPRRQTPIAIFVLHLIELVGRTTPVFISHQYQTKTISDHSYSENVILAFDQYEASKDNYAVSVQMFTAISPPKLMHEDICTLGLNKLTHLIIMPFHRKWGVDGSLESENQNIRTLNCSVLDRSPCSVGILIDRARLLRSNSVGLSSQTNYRVAMIFVGGYDDHEALEYAKRMVKGPGISSLTVIRFVAKDDGDFKEWELMMDNEVLEGVKTSNGNDERIKYKEETVFDGPEMALRIREVVDEFELMVVGRRFKVESPQTSGLAEWSEFAELGIIGDLLASPDLDSRTSVLVVQQQRMAARTKL